MTSPDWETVENCMWAMYEWCGDSLHMKHILGTQGFCGLNFWFSISSNTVSLQLSCMTLLKTNEKEQIQQPFKSSVSVIYLIVYITQCSCG